MSCIAAGLINLIIEQVQLNIILGETTISNIMKEYWQKFMIDKNMLWKLNIVKQKPYEIITEKQATKGNNITLKYLNITLNFS